MKKWVGLQPDPVHYWVRPCLLGTNSNEKTLSPCNTIPNKGDRMAMVDSANDSMLPIHQQAGLPCPWRGDLDVVIPSLSLPFWRSRTIVVPVNLFSPIDRNNRWSLDVICSLCPNYYLHPFNLPNVIWHLFTFLIICNMSPVSCSFCVIPKHPIFCPLSNLASVAYSISSLFPTEMDCTNISIASTFYLQIFPKTIVVVVRKKLIYIY